METETLSEIHAISLPSWIFPLLIGNRLDNTASFYCNIVTHPCPSRYERQGVVEHNIMHAVPQDTWVLVDVLHCQLGRRIEEHVTVTWAALGFTISAREERKEIDIVRVTKIHLLRVAIPN